MAEPATPSAAWEQHVPALHAPNRVQAGSRAHAVGVTLATRHRAEHSVALEDAVGRVVTRDVHAPIPVPHYASSAMDGYAVRGPGPWRVLPLDSALHDAAATAAVDLLPGQAVPIVTGGVIPGGADTVIRDEYAARSGTQLALRDAAPRSELGGRHLRPAGAECAAGEPILRGGTRLSPAHVAWAAVAGLDELPVQPAPVARLLLTGSEVQVSGVPAPGFVRDAFSPVLPPVLAGLGARVDAVHRLPDQAGIFESALAVATAENVALVVTTGGTARSRADHVRSHLERHATLLVDELDLQPGHPTLCAAAGPGTVVLALPGNPLAAMTALTVVGVPLLRGYAGLPEALPHDVRVSQDVAGSRRERLVPARAHRDGTWAVCRAVSPNMLRGLAQAQGLLSVPSQGLRAGERTQVVALPWDTQP